MLIHKNGIKYHKEVLVRFISALQRAQKVNENDYMFEMETAYRESIEKLNLISMDSLNEIQKEENMIRNIINLLPKNEKNIITDDSEKFLINENRISELIKTIYSEGSMIIKIMNINKIGAKGKVTTNDGIYRNLYNELNLLIHNLDNLSRASIALSNVLLSNIKGFEKLIDTLKKELEVKKVFHENIMSWIIKD